MKQYLDLLKYILENGCDKQDRTGTGTKSVFGYQMRFDLSDGFPLLTTKKLHIKSIIHELIWFLRGDTNISYLKKNGVSIWDEWADSKGNLGPIYGHQWRSWATNDGSIDQIKNVIDQIRKTPDSRRMIVSAWNVSDIDKMALPPCHAFFQFYVSNNKLSCQLYQRSCDVFLGLPFNIASYALLTHIMANATNLELGDFVWTGGDVHLYINHINQANEQLKRKPYPMAQLKISRETDNIFDYHYDDFEILNYKSHSHISAPVAI